MEDEHHTYSRLVYGTILFLKNHEVVCGACLTCDAIFRITLDTSAFSVLEVCEGCLGSYGLPSQSPTLGNSVSEVKQTR